MNRQTELPQRFARRLYTTHRQINDGVGFPPDTPIAVRNPWQMQPIERARADDVTPVLRTTLEGAQQSGPTILLVHGFAGSARAWDPLMAALTAAHPIVRVDLIGHGLSPKPMRGYSMPDQVEAICRSLDHLGVASVVAVGHSGGGDVVVEMIRRHPPAWRARFCWALRQTSATSTYPSAHGSSPRRYSATSCGDPSPTR